MERGGGYFCRGKVANWQSHQTDVAAGLTDQMFELSNL